MTRPGQSVFNGRDEVLAAGLLMGASGGIGTFYNLLPDLFVRIYTAATAERWEDARAAQLRVNTLIRAVAAPSALPGGQADPDLVRARVRRLPAASSPAQCRPAG